MPYIDPSGLGEQERDAISEHRWWSLDDIRRSTEKFSPPELADLLGPLIQGNLSPDPPNSRSWTKGLPEGVDWKPGRLPLAKPAPEMLAITRRSGDSHFCFTALRIPVEARVTPSVHCGTHASYDLECPPIAGPWTLYDAFRRARASGAFRVNPHVGRPRSS